MKLEFPSLKGLAADCDTGVKRDWLFGQLNLLGLPTEQPKKWGSITKYPAIWFKSGGFYACDPNGMQTIPKEEYLELVKKDLAAQQQEQKPVEAESFESLVAQRDALDQRIRAAAVEFSNTINPEDLIWVLCEVTEIQSADGGGVDIEVSPILGTWIEAHEMTPDKIRKA